MEILIEYAPFIIPLAVAQIALAVFSVIHAVKHQDYKFGNKTMWIIIVCVFQFVGPAVYFALGRGRDD